MKVLIMGEEDNLNIKAQIPSWRKLSKLHWFQWRHSDLHQLRIWLTDFYLCLDFSLNLLVCIFKDCFDSI